MNADVWLQKQKNWPKHVPCMLGTVPVFIFRVAMFALQTRGEHGHAAYTTEGVANRLLVLFDKLVRGLPEARIRSLVVDVLHEARGMEDSDMIRDLCVLAFQTRWCRGGKGERTVGLVFLKVLYEIFPSVVLELVVLLPQFGSWKDLLELLLLCKTDANAQNDHEVFAPLESKVWCLFSRQLDADWRAFQTGRIGVVSLCAKFCPSEGRRHCRILGGVRHICARLFPGVLQMRCARVRYRKMLSALRAILVVPESLMCAGEWGRIDFGKVPSLCLDRNKRAFLCEDQHGVVCLPQNSHRMACRENLLAAIQTKGGTALKGKQLFPHEVVKQVLHTRILSEGVRAVLEVQWEVLRSGLIDTVSARHVECGGGPARVLVMADVSQSMTGTPLAVSVALGILMSEVAHPAFADRVLTFDDTPAWVDLSGLVSVVDKVEKMRTAPWGGSTDLYAAMLLVADIVRQQKLEQHNIPDLLVVSDMQFDDASWDKSEGKHEWNSVHCNITALFHTLGLELYGTLLLPPKIIFWNVRCDSVGYPTTADQPGVVMLSGFSPALLKFVLADVQTEVSPRRSAQDLLVEVLHDPGLGAVRAVLDGFCARTLLHLD